MKFGWIKIKHSFEFNRNQFKLNSIFFFRFSEVSVRDVMISLSIVSATIGFFVIYIFGSLTEWRNVALICSSVPVVALFALCFVSKIP